MHETDSGAPIERRIVTVLFADLVGFTSLSERLDPEDVATVQDAYFGAVRETIGRYGGQLEKFIGDAAMAVFGLPRSRDDDSERAVRAGLALISAIEQLAVRVGLEEGDLRLRVGVNTGEVVHGEAGPGEWRITGDTVNVAARFQTAAPPGGVLIGETTSLTVADSIDLEAMGAIELKGKAEPVRAWLALGARPVPSRELAMGRLRAPMLGRDVEMASLVEARDRIARGEAERWLIVAPPGVGKSRLLEEFAARLGAGSAVWRARLRPDVLAPYQPVAQLLASALSDNDGLDIEAEAGDKTDRILRNALEVTGMAGARAEVVIGEVRALLFPLADAGEDSGSLGAGEREQRFRAWLDALDALAGDRPAVWIVEDVHWSGGDLLAFLDVAGREASRSGRLVLATARPSVLELAPAWCDASDAYVQVLHLPALSPVAAGNLVSALVGEALPEELVGAVAERSDGNPLFIEELLRTWISVGTLVPEDDGAWRLSRPAHQVPLPATVLAIYGAQLDDLSPPARQAARRASVAGRRFPRDALQPLGVPDPDPAIEVLSRRALVAGPFADPLLGRTHQFRHALLRDAGYASLARAERARLHIRLARWLEEAAGGRWAEVAEVIGNHYRAALVSASALVTDLADGLQSDDASRLAAGWFEKAATAALEVAAHDSARALLRQALDLTTQNDTIDRARRWHRLGDATAYVSDMDEGSAAYETAADLFGSVLADSERGSAEWTAARAAYAASLTSLGLVRIQQLRFNEAVALANTGLETIGPREDAATAWLLYLRAWGTEAFAYKPEVKDDLQRALEIATRCGDRRLELEVNFHLVTVAGEEGSMTRAELGDSDLRAARIAAEIGDWPRACRLLRGRAQILMEEARDESAAALEEASSMAEAHALTEEVAWADYVRTEMGLATGDWGAAVEAGVRALDLADRNSYHRVQVRTWFALSPVALATGRQDLLQRAATWFAAHQEIFPHSPFGNVMHGGVDTRLAAAGLIPPPQLDPQELLPAWEESQGMPSWYAAVETIVGAWVAAGRLEAARAVLDRVAAWIQHPLTEALGRGSERLMRAWLLTAEGELEGAVTAAQAALVEFRVSDAPWWVAKAIRALDGAGRPLPNISRRPRRSKSP